MKKFCLLFSLLGVLAVLDSCSNFNNQWNKLSKWYSSDQRMYLPNKLEEGKSCYYIGDIKNGIFKNFEFTAKLKVSDGGLARFWFHTNKELGKGYRILLNNNNKSEIRRTGSLEDVRSRYKATIAPGEVFNLHVIVKDKNIQVDVNDVPIVEYTESNLPYRIEKNQGEVLSEGLLAFEALKGKLSIYEASVKPLVNYIPKYRNSRAIPARDETTDKVIRLEQEKVPLIDYHVYAKGTEKTRMYANMSRSCVSYGLLHTKDILPLLVTDEDKLNFMAKNYKDPLHFTGIHLSDFDMKNNMESKELKSLFDYVVGDARTMIDHRGRLIRLWVSDEVKVDIPVQSYMDMIVNNIVKMLNEEDIDIYVNPTFLPEVLSEYYNELWTESRIYKVVNALSNRGIAVEINSQLRIPNLSFLKIAKKEGVRFAIGSDGVGSPLDQLDYAFNMMDSLQLSKEDMFFPF